MARNIFHMTVKLLARIASVAWLAVLLGAGAALAASPSEQPVAGGPATTVEQKESSPSGEETQPVEERIEPGVSAGGIALGGLTVAEARTKLKQALAESLHTSIALESGGQLFELDVTRIGLTLDALRTAKRALRAGKRLRRARPRSKSGVNVPLVIAYNRAKVRGFSRRVAEAVDIRPREAKVRVGITKVKLVRTSHDGERLQRGQLTRRIVERLRDPSIDRAILQDPKPAKARLTTREARRAYRTVLTIDRDNFKLRLFKGFKLRKTYGIALGAIGYSTPSGIFKVANKQVNPAWHAPNKPWAGAYAGKTVPGGSPQNPLKARWLGIRDGVGIHGTSAEWSIGTRASHGCIRMRVGEVVDLYGRVPVGTPIRIS